MARRRIAKIPTPGPGELAAAIPVVVPDRHQPGIEDWAAKMAHDELVKMLGDTRVSPVWWSSHIGRQGEAMYHQLCKALGQPVDETCAGVFAGDLPRVLVVVAWAITNGPPRTFPGGGRWEVQP